MLPIVSGHFGTSVKTQCKYVRLFYIEVESGLAEPGKDEKSLWPFLSN